MLYSKAWYDMGLLTGFFGQKFSVSLNIAIENTGYRGEEMVLKHSYWKERES